MERIKPYPAYKASGVEWLGEVPAHWEVRSIKTLFQEKDQRSGDGQGVLLSLTREHGIVPHEKVATRVASSSDLSKYKVCLRGELVMNRMQAWSGMFSVSAVDGLVSPDYSVFAPARISEICVKFFEYLFRTTTLVDQFAKRSKGIGSGFNRLYTPDFGSVLIAAPPLPEQHAIVRFLDHATHNIRRYIDAKLKLIGLLEGQRQAIVQQAVTRGLDPGVSLKDSGVEWLGEVPEHWEVRRLKTVTANVIVQTDKRDNSDIYLALEHVEGWTGRYRDPGPDVDFDSQVKRFQVGDVLFGKLRPYLAKVTNVSHHGVCVGEFLVLRSDALLLSSAYLARLLCSESVIDAVNASTFGAKMPRADWHFMGSMRFPFPPLSEQHAIVEYLDKATASIDTAIDRTRRQIELMEEYRTRLISDVVTGKLDVRKAVA